MAMSTQARMLCLGLCLAFCAASSGGSFRGVRTEGAGRTVATEEVEASLRATLEAVLRGGEGAAAKQLEIIEARIWQTYEALPKNDFGRLGPRAVRYLVHNYFAREHGWIIQGLEPHGNQEQVSEMHEMNILQDKAPALVEGLLEAQRGDRGLSLGDTVAMVAALERLIYDESLELLQASYDLNGLTPSEAIGESNMHEVLTSYLLLFEMGHKANLTDSKRHQLLKQRASEAGGNWPTLVDFERDSVLNYGFAKKHQSNPFVEQSFTFQEATDIMEGLASGYGKWQNMECRAMKQDLMELDPDGTGRVPVSRFYSQPDSADYHFTESLDYLRQIGALDETAGEARVRIANYMAGPSNCIATSSYYSVCCLSECEGLMNELEAKVHAPAVEPERLLNLVSNVSSSTVDGHRQLPKALRERIHEIAGLNGGQVPLHGRLFAQWMHHAFPNECPYPEITEDASVLTPSHWLDKSAILKSQEREELAKSQAPTTSTAQTEIAWSDEEVLHAHAAPTKPSRSALGSVVRVAMQLAMLLGVLRVALGNWKTVAGACDSVGKAKKTDFELPF